MAKLGELTGPVMRSTACLQPYRANRLRWKKPGSFPRLIRLRNINSTPLIRSVNVKDVLGDLHDRL
jgi:hypothetical protein